MKREDFPMVEDFIYLDSAATSLTPIPVLQAMSEYYEDYNANVHRGSSTVGAKATQVYEDARSLIATFIGAKPQETIITSGTTQGLNLAARIVCQALKPGDEILIPISEHHSNFVVWQQLAKAMELQLRFLPVDETGLITPALLEQHLTERTKVFSFAHISNTLGVVQPLKELTEHCHAKDITVVVDGAQGIAHVGLNVMESGVDFYAFSGHKILGPTGVGVLYGREELLARAEPNTYGGEMIREVTTEETTWNELPWKFEAGTPPIAQVIGLAAALHYYAQQHDKDYLQQLTAYTREQLESIDGLKLYGTAREKAPVFAFSIEGLHATDVAHILNSEGIQIREGHHCAQPLLKHFGLASLARISLLDYNTQGEVDAAIAAIQKAIKLLRGKA